MTLNVTFKLGTDPDKAQQLVQNRVSQAEPRCRRRCAASASPPQELAGPPMVVHMHLARTAATT
jgi:multidrug efflux pump subunit AcrB